MNHKDAPPRQSIHLTLPLATLRCDRLIPASDSRARHLPCLVVRHTLDALHSRPTAYPASGDEHRSDSGISTDTVLLLQLNHNQGIGTVGWRKS